MAASWQDVAIQQAELISSRLRELLSLCQGLLNSELGVDLGLKPERYPSWVLLLTAFLGVLVIVVFWAAACVGLFGGRKRGAREIEQSSQSTKALVPKIVKAEEQKKKNKKKPVEKKSQPNGRTVVELPEEDVKATIEELLKQAPDIKTEKTKKNKKKLKAELKETQLNTSANGKEHDEGAWETKISNREKRQQRRRDKVLNEDSSSPGAESPASVPMELPTAITVVPVSVKKSKEPLRVKTGKGDAIISHVSASWNETATVNGGGWNNKVMKIPVSSVDRENCTAWGLETEGSWRPVEGRIRKADLNPASISTLGLTSTVTGEEPGSQTNADLQWDSSQIKADDVWSGINGLSTLDPSSDWNAPSELWGNYEEPKAPAPTHLEKPVMEVKKISDDEKEKTDSAAPGSGKSKKKKKKKKKQDEEANTQETEEQEKESLAEVEEVTLSAHPEKESILPVQSTAVSAPVEVKKLAQKELASPVLESVSKKTPSQVPQRLSDPEPPVSTAKQNSMPPPSQKKSEENWESPKQVKKKKKARRET
ncbi:metadherin a [Amia ocellicauda]|uniref:metadherin a n=1 Tax=Amia ocellicauda TaxID=2972642 RepID=UPI00346472AC